MKRKLIILFLMLLMLVPLVFTSCKTECTREYEIASTQDANCTKDGKIN